MNNQIRLGVLLNSDPYYTDVKRRIDDGELVIDIGKNNWPEGWYRDPYFNVSVPLALEIAQALPDVKKFSLYYQREIDFHNIMFDYDGDTYCVQWYKIFTIHRKSDDKKYYIPKYEIAHFFKSGRYKTTPHWGEGSKLYSPFRSKPCE